MKIKNVRRAAIALALIVAARPSGAQAGMSHMHTNMPAMTDPLGVSMDRFGSGTTWLPDDVSLPARRGSVGPWYLMMHGFAFVQQTEQGGPRGGSQFGSLNWGMFMASRDLAGGRFQARTMLSLDALTVTPRGYPLLLQTGESYNGEPLHDRQHPHDFFMELAAMYERPITSSVGVFAYAAPSGEPALGPVAFMHRPSAMDLPSAPIGHHWQDATHISFGVLTGGIFGHNWKLEGSAFNGREPDQYRWNLESMHFDSYSSRFTVNPSKAWSISAGYGFIHGAEADEPEASSHRITASVLHGTKLGEKGQWSSTLIWGANKEPGSALSHSALAESEAVMDEHNTVFARAEWVQKTAEEIAFFTPSSVPHIGEKFPLSAITAGYIREVHRWSGASVGLGAMGTLNVVPGTLRDTYGSRTPVGGMLFLRLKPISSPPMNMTGMKMN